MLFVQQQGQDQPQQRLHLGKTTTTTTTLLSTRQQLPSRSTMTTIRFLFLLALLPFATPFATASGGSGRVHPSQQQQQQQQQRQQHPSTKYQENGQTSVSARTTASRPFQQTQQQILPHTQRSKTIRQLSVSSAVISTFQRRKQSFQQKIAGMTTPLHSSEAATAGEGKASILSKLFYNYATPLIQKSKHQRLDVEDAFEVAEHRKMDTAVEDLKRIYREQRATHVLDEGGNNNKVTAAWLFTRALLLHQRPTLIQTGILRLANTAIQALPAILVARLLRLAESPSMTSSTHTTIEALKAALWLVSVLTMKMIIENQYFHHVIKCATQVRGAIAGCIFDKSLKLHGGGSSVTHVRDSNDKTTRTKMNTKNKKQQKQQQQQQQQINNEELGVGGVLNLMQSDTSIIESATVQFHTIWDGPLQIAIYTSLLYRYLGPSVFWGIAVLLGTIPLNSVTLRLLNRLSKFENKARDSRTKQTAESIRNMKLLKLQGWEQRFASDIRMHRQAELRQFILRGFVRAMNMAISNAVPAIVLVVTLTAYVKTGRPIVASTIFTAISLFNQLRFPLFFYPMLIDSLANGRNAMRRIATYLDAEEIVPYVRHLPPKPLSSSNNGDEDLITSVPESTQTNIPLTNYNNNKKHNGVAQTAKTSSTSTGGSIEMKNGNFFWSASPSSSSAAATTVATRAKKDEKEEGKEKRADEKTNAAVPNTSVPALKDVELTVQPGEIVAVVGSVGSGKSALIKGLLGELSPVPRPIIEQAIKQQHQHYINKGRSSMLVDGETEPMEEIELYASAQQSTSVFDKPSVTTYGDVAYCSQEAWLSKGTIREAVVFGREYNEERYLAAIRDAGLDDDIVDENQVSKMKKAGNNGVLTHETDVGEGGSALSGGQRARVALARALYSADDTKVFLVDDCLAALDAHVGSVVFDRMTERLRKSNAATVMVTNDPNIPRRCDRVILMGPVSESSSCSTIIDEGTYDELLARGHDLRSFSHSDHENEELDQLSDYDNDNRDGFDAGAVNGNHGRSESDENIELLSPALTTIKKNEVLVAGTNGTELCNELWSHADVENQATMEQCPDYFTQMAGFQNSRRNDTNGESPAFEYYQASNHTVDINMIPVEQDHAEKVEAKSPQQDMESTKISSNVKQIASADDNMSAGAVPFSVYASYFKAVGNPLLVFAMLGAYLLSNGAQFFQQYTVAKWTEVGSTALGSSVGSKYLRNLVKAAGVVSISLWIRSFMTMSVGVKASRTMHARMLQSVFTAPMSFFDATPSGQLLSRFGKEIETVDRGVPDSIGSVLFCFLQIFLSVGALAGIITPGMLIPLAAVSILYVNAMGKFRPAARDMKRAETKTRSPIYTHFGEAVRGSETIRSVRGAPSNWNSRHRYLTDRNLGVFYTVKAFDRWLSARLESLGNTVVFATAIASVFLTSVGRLKAGSAGWGLTQALSITGLLTWAVRCLTDLETNMMSVMRVRELTDLDSEEADLKKLKARGKKNLSDKKKTMSKMPKEMAEAGEALKSLLPNSQQLNTSMAPLKSDALLNDGWPWRGNVQFNNVSMRYNPSSPLVLKGVDLTVPAGTTLGVVGRTGSGKSSLLVTLFRLVEIENGGSIEIDGVDIRSIKLESLRQSIAIIPQDPVLFTGTLAYNLDATGRSSPEDMMAALEAASPLLADQFRKGDGLESHVSEGGKNLSLGQRQLICLARALLRKSKILVLDEATSSVDAKTDQEVQTTIRREFVEKGVTVITVAHRLDTVLGYDKIAVLGNGKLLEYGTPDELVALPNGELRRLVLADRRNKQKGSKKNAKIAVPAAA